MNIKTYKFARQKNDKYNRMSFKLFIKSKNTQNIFEPYLLMRRFLLSIICHFCRYSFFVAIY